MYDISKSDRGVSTRTGTHPSNSIPTRATNSYSCLKTITQGLPGLVLVLRGRIGRMYANCRQHFSCSRRSTEETMGSRSRGSHSLLYERKTKPRSPCSFCAPNEFTFRNCWQKPNVRGTVAHTAGTSDLWMEPVCLSNPADFHQFNLGAIFQAAKKNVCMSGKTPVLKHVLQVSMHTQFMQLHTLPSLLTAHVVPDAHSQIHAPTPAVESPNPDSKTLPVRVNTPDARQLLPSPQPSSGLSSWSVSVRARTQRAIRLRRSRSTLTTPSCDMIFMLGPGLFHVLANHATSPPLLTFTFIHSILTDSQDGNQPPYRTQWQAYTKPYTTTQHTTTPVLLSFRVLVSSRLVLLRLRLVLLRLKHPPGSFDCDIHAITAI